jgi:hypothetical protein
MSELSSPDAKGQAAKPVAADRQPVIRKELVWRVAQGLMLLAALVLVLHYGYKTILGLAQKGKEGVSDTIHAAGEEVGRMVSKFNQGTISQTFVAALPTLARTPGGILELAALSVTEIFSRADQKTTAWGWINLGTTVTEIKVPVTYRYHLRLYDPWVLTVSNHVCVVYAPGLRATRPPAIHTDRLEKRADAGWLRFDSVAQLDDLERSITPTLNLYAPDARHIALVKEECRKTLAEFVRAWLLHENQWSDDRFHTIKVIFPDEKDRPADQVSPTITLRRD